MITTTNNKGGQSAEYAPQSGEIVGILKQLGDELSKGLSEARKHHTKH